MQKRWKTGLAKLLTAALLLQGMPMWFGGTSTAQAEGTVTGQTYGTGTPISSTYGPNPGTTKITDYKWSKVDIPNLTINPRSSMTMVYDENADNIVMFGGQGNGSSDGGLLDETFIWDRNNKKWTEQLGPSLAKLDPSPPKRKGAVMAYDPSTGKVLLFGGVGKTGLLNDTWMWDGINATWEEVTGLTVSPSARGGAQLAYDGQQLVLYGGYSGSENAKTILGDTWLWNGSAWTQAQSGNPSPPPAYNGRMAFDGYTAVLYGGDIGSVTKDYAGTAETKTYTHDDSSPLLWKWDRDTQSWSSVDGPEGYGRWGQAMAYDGRRVVLYSGERDYVHLYSSADLVPKLKLPSTRYPPMRGGMLYAWTGSKWEKYPLPTGVGSESIFQSATAKDGKVYDTQVVPNKVPFPLTNAGMAFDGKNFVVFGGERGKIDIVNFPLDGNAIVDNYPAGNVNETWLFGYTPPTAPGVRFDNDPIINFDTEPLHLNDSVSVITNVYDNGTRTITAQGIEYRMYTETNANQWIKVPYTGDVSEDGMGAFTVELKGLTWHQKYETRGYAINEIGTSYTPVKSFIMEDDPNMTPPKVEYNRVGASVLHVKDAKKIVAVGTGITNLLRKPISDIHYFLQAQNGTQYPLKYNVVNDRQLELTWTENLPPGKYDVYLNHAYYKPDFVSLQGLMITALDFYKPRNFARVDVPSTSPSNEVNSLGLQGPFTEDPSAEGKYVLDDTSEPVVINDSVMFKGSNLVVTKDKITGKSTISGEGRLYVNGNGALGASVSYTLLDGAFTLSSDDFSIAINGAEAADYLNIGMPVKASKLIFAKDGLRLTGDLEVGLQLGSQKVSNSVPVTDMNFRNNRFDLTGTYDMNKDFKIGPFNAKNTQFVVDSRIPYVGVKGIGSLPDTDISFDLNMKTKQGRLDGISFGMYNKVKLASTGLQVNYLFGSASNLADKTEIPQKLAVTGSVNDIIVPELKHPQVNYKFNLLGTDSIDMNVSSSGFTATGIEYYYWFPVNNMNMQTVVNPKVAAIQGFSSPGFLAKGDINVFEMIKGVIASYSFNKKGFDGAIKGTVYVPKGIPRIGGATVNNVIMAVDNTGIYGTFKHNGIGANVKYTFNNNTMLFEVEAEPPKKSWWEKGLDFVNNLYNSVDQFLDKAQPWLDIAEELFLIKPDSRNLVNIAAADDLKKVFDLTPVSLSFQPEDTAIQNVKARMVDGQFTTLDRTPAITVETNASNGQTTSEFKVERAYNAFITMSGDQRSTAISGSTAENFYDAASDTTFMRVSLNKGTTKLTTKGSSRISVNELLFADPAMKLDALTGLWKQTPERTVTSLTVEERGSYVLKVGAAQGEVIVYKPDGRPYNLQTQQNQPDWNAYRDANGNVYARIDVVQAGTWIVSAGTSPTAALNSVSEKATIGDVVQWLQAGAYPNVFKMSSTDNGQAIVEIYDADAQTKLYAPNGQLYAFQSDPNMSGMNASYDEGQRKLTVLLDGVKLDGEWKAVSSSFTSVIAYKASRKFRSIKPMFAEGRYTRNFELADNGNYMLTVSGGDANTVIISPDGKQMALNFNTPDGNAYLQPAADRVASGGGSGDPLQQPQVETPNPVQDGRDMLYVSLLDAQAGKWSIQSAKHVDIQTQKLRPLPSIKASVSPVSGNENRIQVTWSMENTTPDSRVTVMLTNSADQLIGEVIAEDRPASGSETIDIPAMTMPGTYYLSVAGTVTGKAPVYAVAGKTVEVTAPYTLNTPERPEVLSTGNGEVSLRFASISGNVSTYRIWASGGTYGQTAVPVMDMTPQTGDQQQALIIGLPAGDSYTFTVSAIGQEQGRVVLSPQSAGVTAELPVPQPAALTLSLDAGSSVVKEQTYSSYDGSEGTLLATAAEQASLKVAADQNASLTLSANGQQLGTGQVAAGGTYTFALNELLNVSVLKEREYNLSIEAMNGRGDRTMVYRKLFIDRTGPMLIASGGNDAQGKPISLNGTIVDDGKAYITGQTDPGAKLDVNGTTVPLDDQGRFVYYIPVDWSAQPDRTAVKITASDEVGNKTEYGFELLRGVAAAPPTYPGDLASLTTGGAKMNSPYVFGTTAYQASAYADKVRVYAIPMVASSVVTVDGQPLSSGGYAEVTVPAAGRSVQVLVHPSSGADKTYTLQIGGMGSSVAALSTLKLKNVTAAQPGEELAAKQPFTGAEASYSVSVDNTVEKVTLTPGALKDGSSITVKGQPVLSGQASQNIQLQVGENKIPVIVTSPDRSATRTYDVSVWRAQSGNALLKQLGLATNGAVLTSAFNPAKSSYQVLVPYSTDTFTLLPVADQSDATIRIDGQTVTSSAISLPFTKTAQSFAIEVKAQDGTVSTYNVSVLRKQSQPAQPPLLKSLQATPGLDSVFDPYKLRYGTTASTITSVAPITAVASDPQATVTVKGVSLKGGGSFSPILAIGENTVIVNVEAADLASSQTYSVDVKRLANSQSRPAEDVRQTPISGGTGWTDQTSIVRSVAVNGVITDTVKLDAGKARDILEKASSSKDNVARIYVTDLPDAPANERVVTLSADFVSALGDGRMSLQIMLPDAQLTISAASLAQLNKDGKDAYFRIVPVRAADERSEVSSRVQSADLVQQAAGGKPVIVIGQPVKIETNYSGYKTEILFPLNNLTLPADEAAAKQMLSQLAVYIEHSDGEKELLQGEIRYDAAGKPSGLAIVIDKFSTFTLIQKSGPEASKVLAPYLSGYPDGTFRPAQAITRAELATILDRAGARSASGESASAQAAGYPDVAAGHWAAEAIAHVQSAGLMLGDNNGLFRPDDAVSRSEMASIAARLLQSAATDASASGEYADTQGHWASDEVKRASQAGILQGYPDGSFQPDTKLNRAEAVKVLNRLFERPTAEAQASSWPDVPKDHWAVREIESASGTVKLLPDGSLQVVPSH